MALTGGFVAGIRAGFAYNTFPLMNGHLVPPEILMLEPWWMNFFNNMATVQFDHRLIAWLLALAVPLLWWQAMRTTPALPRARALAPPVARHARRAGRARHLHVAARRAGAARRRRIRPARCSSSPHRSMLCTRYVGLFPGGPRNSAV